MAGEQPRVLLRSNNQQLRKAVKEALSPVKVTARRVSFANMPNRASAIVTTSAIGSRTSFLAMRMGTGLMFVLPEAAMALEDHCKRQPPEGNTIVLVGADVAQFDPIAAGKQTDDDQEVIL
jgi:hypothetical protein